MVAVTKATKNLRDATLTISDGTGTPLTLVIPIMDGDLSVTERPPEAIPVLNRGVLSHFAKGPDNPVTLSFSFKFVSYAGLSNTTTDAPTVIEALKGTGNASAWVSTNNCGPFVVDLIWSITKNTTDAADQNEVITFSDFHADEFVIDEGEEFNTVRVTGKALQTAPVGVRS